MKKVLIGASLALLLSACGTAEKTNIQQDKADEPKAKTAEEAKTTETKKQEDIWTYYDNATWTDNYDGLVSTIKKVVVTDKAPKLDGSDGTESAVGVKFQLENTTQDKFTTYPDQAVLVTSTGEQIDMPQVGVSDHIGGEIDKGVIKEGNLIWYLKRGQADQITWIKLKWNARKGPENQFDATPKTYEIELKLK